MPQLIVSKKDAVLWISDIRVDGKGIEVVGEIETAPGEAQRIFAALDGNVFEEPRVGRQVVGEAGTVAERHANIISESVQPRVGEAAPVLDHGQKLESLRQIHPPPGQKAVRDVTRQIRVDCVTH
jgi:hypothetical protein